MSGFTSFMFHLTANANDAWVNIIFLTETDGALVVGAASEVAAVAAQAIVEGATVATVPVAEVQPNGWMTLDVADADRRAIRVQRA